MRHRHRAFRCALTSLGSAALLAGCGSSPPAEQQAAASAIDNLTAPAPTNVAETSVPKRRTREQLREQARTDPEGADAQAIEQMSRTELLATSINSAGFLCARVTDFYLSGSDIVAHCVEYRSGKGRVSYRIDPRASSVEQID